MLCVCVCVGVLAYFGYSCFTVIVEVEPTVKSVLFCSLAVAQSILITELKILKSAVKALILTKSTLGKVI